MMNKSLRRRGQESSHNADYGFRLPSFRGAAHFARSNPESTSSGLPLDSGFARKDARPGMTGGTAKKEPPFPAAFEVDNREASNRVDRSHSVSKQGQMSNSRESLIDRKRTVLLRRG
jgi:hypothetical protein